MTDLATADLAAIAAAASNAAAAATRFSMWQETACLGLMALSGILATFFYHFCVERLKSAIAFGFITAVFFLASFPLNDRTSGHFAQVFRDHTQLSCRQVAEAVLASPSQANVDLFLRRTGWFGTNGGNAGFGCTVNDMTGLIAERAGDNAVTVLTMLAQRKH